MPYCLNCYSLVGNVRMEDWVFCATKTSIDKLPKYNYTVLESSSTSGDFKIYYDKFQILKNIQTNYLYCLDKNKYKYNNKYGDDFYKFTDEIEWFNGNEIEIKKIERK